MPGEAVPEILVYTLVQQDPQLVARQQRFLRLFQSLQRHSASHRRESFPKALETVPGFKVVEQRSHQNPCASKSRLPGHNCRIANDNRVHKALVWHRDVTTATFVRP